MRKELLWAAGIGISFGLIIGFGAWRINTFVKKESITATSSPAPSASPSEFKITLDKPENDDVVTDSPLTISGITKSSAWILISGEKADYVLQAGTDGVFSEDIDLTAGVNQIKVTAFDPNGSQSIQKVLVVYSSSFQVTAAASPSPNDNSTESAIRAKVAEKVAEALNKPKAYIGVVTDIADSTVQIKNTDSEIEQISVADEGLTIVNQKGTNNKTVKLSDVAIGDFIVAMGYVSSKSVLSAQRIIVADPITEPKIDSDLAAVTAISKKSLTASDVKDGSTNTVTPDSKTDIESYIQGKMTAVKLASINAGDLIIVTTDSSGDTPVVRSVFVIQKASPTPTP